MPPTKPSATSREDRNSDLEDAIRRALAGRARPEDVINLVTLAVATRDAPPTTDKIKGMVNSLRKEVARDQQPTLLYHSAYGADKGFLDPDRIPEGAVLIKDIARELSISPKTIHRWIKSGRMKEIARVGGKGSGAGGFVVVWRCDVYRCHAEPRKGGRPRTARTRSTPATGAAEATPSGGAEGNPNE